MSTCASNSLTSEPMQCMTIPSEQVNARLLQKKCQAWVPPLIMAVLLLSIVALLPLKSVVRIGGDEGYELLKSAMVAHGTPLYTAIWNDQPPLHTLVLSTLFKLFGASALVGRLTSVAFAIVLMTAVLLSIKREGILTRLLLGALLLCAPTFLELATSAMLELPAVALGYASAAVLLTSCNGSRTNSRLVLSGGIFGLALMVKLTVAMLIPGMLICIAEERFRPSGSWEFTAFLKRVSLWLLAVATVVAITFLLCPGLSHSSLTTDHFSARARELLGLHPGAHFQPLSVLDQHREAVVAFPACLILCLLSSSLRNILFPLCNLIVVLTVLSVHVPYWSFYYLHIGIPLAWLAAIGISRCFEFCQGAASHERHWASQVGWLCVACALLSFAAVECGSRTSKQVFQIRESKTVNQSALISEMQRRRTNEDYIFSYNPEYVFYSGMSAIPELAVIPYKRIASGLLDDEKVLGILERYRPRELVLKDFLQLPGGWTKFLSTYQIVAAEDGFALYVLKEPTSSLLNGSPRPVGGFRLLSGELHRE